MLIIHVSGFDLDIDVVVVVPVTLVVICHVPPVHLVFIYQILLFHLVKSFHMFSSHRVSVFQIGPAQLVLVVRISQVQPVGFSNDARPLGIDFLILSEHHASVSCIIPVHMELFSKLFMSTMCWCFIYLLSTSCF